MSIFKQLAQALSDRSFFVQDEVEELIEVYFNIFISDIKNRNFFTEDIEKRKMEILSEMNQLSIKRSMIEKQLFDAKAKIKDGGNVDMYWMSRANFAFRITKQQIVFCQSQLTKLSLQKKKINIESSQSEQELFVANLKKILQNEIGKDAASAIFEKAGKSVTESNS